MIYPFIRNSLFLLPPETAHNVSMKGLDMAAALPLLNTWLSNHFQVQDPSLSKTVFGLHFPNPVDLVQDLIKTQRI